MEKKSHTDSSEPNQYTKWKETLGKFVEKMRTLHKEECGKN